MSLSATYENQAFNTLYWLHQSEAIFTLDVVYKQKISYKIYATCKVGLTLLSRRLSQCFHKRFQPQNCTKHYKKLKI